MKNVLNKRNISLILAAVVLAVFYFLPDTSANGGLSHEAFWAVGIFFASLIMWIGVSIDWPSLISMFMIGLLPTYGFSKMLSGSFGNSTVAFLMFTFMLVYPLSQTNFVRRVTVAFITNKVAKKGPWHFVCFLFAAITLIGLFILLLYNLLLIIDYIKKTFILNLKVWCTRRNSNPRPLGS